MKDKFVSAVSPDAAPATPPKPKSNIIWRIVKWSALSALFLYIIFTVLARLGGSSDVLRSSIEDFLTQNTPYTAKITKLNSMQFFPDVVLDLENLELRRGEAGEGEAAIRVASVRIAVGFFDMLFGHHQIKALHIQGFYAAPETLIGAPIRVHELAIRDLDNQSFLDLVGKIGEAPFSLKIGLDGQGEPGQRIYTLGKERDFDVILGDVTAKGHLGQGPGGALHLSDFQMDHNKNPVLTGNLDLRRKDPLRYQVQGDVQPAANQTPYKINLLVNFDADPLLLRGTVQADGLSPETLKSDQVVLDIIQAIDDVLNNVTEKDDKFSLNGVNLDLTLELNNFRLGDFILGTIKTPLILKDNVLKLSPLSGDISGGVLSGEAILNAAADPATLDINTKITDFDYAAFQKQIMQEADIEGRANIVVKLSSQGQSMDALLGGLTGSASFVGGRGHLRSGLLDVWGGGLVKAIVPRGDKDSNLDVNCVVVDMDIKKTHAQGKSIFVDTKSVTLQGDGTYDFGKDYLEIILDPKAKEVAIGDIGTAVNVTGPLGDLKVTPNMFDLGKRVGGVLAGALNPAFYALTLTDLGLAEDHPCKAFVIEKEELPPPVAPEE